MTAIPLGLTGALAGLYALDLNLGALAIMGVRLKRGGADPAYRLVARETL